MARHDEIVRTGIEARRGYIFSTSGDGFAAAFWTPGEAVSAATDIQSSLASEPWPLPVVIAVRMGVHTGTADERDGDYFGPTLNRAARLMSAANAGQVLLSSVTAQLLGTGDALDLGVQRLKDLAAPERVFQVGSQPFPPLRSSGSASIRLPEWDTRFWGRRAEMDALRQRVVEHRVVVLTGPGGLGKTRLAAHVAQQLVDEFPDGIYFIGLAGISAEATDNAIADGIGVRREPDRSVPESVVAWLGDRRVLLVLDNCEEVVPAARGAVQPIVRHCPQVHLLVTSRVPLGVVGEVRMPLRPLDQVAAVDLFVDRVAIAGRELDRDPTAEELCGRLDGVPLALELAAARCRTLTPHELLIRLERTPEVLTDATGIFDERHRDLDRLIKWSWHELSSTARRVLARLTVMIGGFTVDAAEAVASDAEVHTVDVVRALEEVEESGLMIQEVTDLEVRHRLLEPIRQRVAALSGDAERRQSERRHARWFVDVARAVGRGAEGPDFGRWADLVERDFPNFRQAHRHLCDAGDAEAAVAILGGLSLVCRERGIMELADWCDATIPLVRGRHDDVEMALLSAACRFWLFQKRGTDLNEAAARMASAPSAMEHQLYLQAAAVEASLDPARWPDAIAQFEDLLARYGDDTSWASAEVACFLVLLGGLDASAVDPIARRMASPVFSARLAFYRSVTHYLHDEDRFAAALVADALSLARSAGATFQVANNLMALGGWRARLP